MKSALVETQESMRCHGVRGNFTPAENLHLTLAFIGEVQNAESVVDALADVVFTPFELSLDGVGRFGDLWWAGVQDSAALRAIVRRIRRALAVNDIPFDRKCFSPHITLLRRASRDIEGIRFVPASMMVRTISIMSSRRGRNGMIYTEIGVIEADF